jgi:WD40 repeat protein
MSYHDLRCQNTTVLTFDKIKSEVCGITFKNNFVACGLNNGKIHLWDIRKTSLLKRVYHHTGAVKAIKWCPWKTNLLVSGGGNNDHKVVFWNFETEKIVNECDLKSQITSIGFRESSEEILTSHAGS